jgi:hypothetical protein
MIDRECPICGKTYQANPTRLKWGRQTTCSRKCSYQLRAEKLTQSSQIPCPVCGTVFTAFPSRIKDAKYTPVCSLDCLYKGRSLGIIKREITTPYKAKGPTTELRDCEICGESFSCHPNSPQKYCTRRCFELAHSENMSGTNNPAYIDGSSFNAKTFRGSNWAIIRRTVYERDSYICQSCGTKCVSKSAAIPETNYSIIQCHHIKLYASPEDNGLDNLTTLCLRCHLRIHNTA